MRVFPDMPAASSWAAVRIKARSYLLPPTLIFSQSDGSAEQQVFHSLFFWRVMKEANSFSPAYHCHYIKTTQQNLVWLFNNRFYSYVIFLFLYIFSWKTNKCSAPLGACHKNLTSIFAFFLLFVSSFSLIRDQSQKGVTLELRLQRNRAHH